MVLVKTLLMMSLTRLKYRKLQTSAVLRGNPRTDAHTNQRIPAGLLEEHVLIISLSLQGHASYSHEIRTLFGLPVTHVACDALNTTGTCGSRTDTIAFISCPGTAEGNMLIANLVQSIYSH